MSTITTTMTTILSKDEMRALRFAESSRRIVGANWTNQEDPLLGRFPPTPHGWMSLEAYIASENAYDPDDPEAGWQHVPSARVLRKRAAAALRRRARAAGMTTAELRSFAGALADAEWLGRSDA